MFYSFIHIYCKTNIIVIYNIILFCIKYNKIVPNVSLWYDET